MDFNELATGNLAVYENSRIEEIAAAPVEGF